MSSKLLLSAIIIAFYLNLSASQDIEKLKYEMYKHEQLKDTVAETQNHEEFLQQPQLALQSLWKTDFMTDFRMGPLLPQNATSPLNMSLLMHPDLCHW